MTTPTNRLAELSAVWRTDFQGFASQLDIVDKEGVRGKLRPNAIQAAFEATRSANGRDIVLKPRQVGLTTWELARDLWFFLTRQAARVVVVVQTDSDHKPLRETSEKIRIMLESLEAQGLRFEWRAQNVSEWVLGDASLRIIEAGASEAKAAKQGRGGTIHRLHITELAFFEFAKDTLNAMLECVPSSEAGSEIVIESTANGNAGVFFERYNRAKLGQSDYTPHFFRWVDQAEYRMPLAEGEVLEPERPREHELVDRHAGTPEQLKWYRKKVEDKGQDLVDQEYPLDEETCWLIAGRLFFDRNRVVALKAKTRTPIAVELGGALRIWKQPERAVTYVVIADPSEGTGGDPGAAIVLDRVTLEHVASLHGQFPVGLMADHLDFVGRKYNTATVVVERNNHGVAVLELLVSPPRHSTREAYPKLYKDRDKKRGWYMTETSRSAALDGFEDTVRGNQWETPDERLVGEMLTFIVVKTGKAEAASGAHDDLVITAAIGNAVCRRTMQSTGAVAAPMPQARSDFESRQIG